MSRRNFILKSAGLTGALLSEAAFGKPCPPSSLSTDGGSSVSASCTTTSGTGPSWFASQADKTWVQPFTSFRTLDSVKPVPTPPGTTDQNSPSPSAIDGVIIGWSGGVVGDNGLYVFGGGHGDYAGNEVYFVDAVAARCRRLSDPSAVSGGNLTTYGDGQPRPPHTYRHLVHTPGSVWLTAQAGPNPSGDSRRTVWRFDLATKKWGFVDDQPGSVNFVECGSVYDPVTQLIYIVNQEGQVTTLNPATRAMAHVNSNFVSGANLGNALTLWPEVGALIYWAPNGTVSLLNVAAPAAGWRTISVSGALGISNYPGFFWHRASKKIVAWGHTNNRASLFTLAPPNPNATSFSQALGTWTATAVPAAAGNAVTPSSPARNGTFNRFSVIENLGGSGRDAIVLLNYAGETPYFYKLPSAGL